ncbi:B-cell CLL/lymphoma 6 member B protein isoform X3 [Pelodiscus sinensis]|uniref:B-cell CLL/lymphoma 6 member B protein isoform X3 n=1 Tax=Pelodiscus sinensis TaxID=13735 RepID=UPI003F6BCF54
MSRGTARGPAGCVREFTRHAGDVLLNLDQLRHRHVLTDVTLLVGGRPLLAHKAVLAACSGFFYSIFLGQGGSEVSVLNLPSSIQPGGFQALLDFMYTSRLSLTPASVPALLSAATYIQMEHVVATCHRFIQARSHPTSLQCPLCHETGTLLHPPCPHLPQQQLQPPAGAGPYSCRACKLALGDDEEEEGGLCGEQAPVGISHDNKPFKCQLCHSAFRYKGNLASHRAVHTGEKPYRCGLCGAQFNRPANLKTHSRIHSGEKPYKCETCGSSFVQVAHLRAHVLIHTGEKPYPCETCGTRFRHLQTLKSHIRIHTGEKPYHCETCHLHFRHKSQLRLHLRQKHGAITNTKIRYTVLNSPSGASC